MGTSDGLGSYSIDDLLSVPTIAAADLVGISQNGADRSITYDNLINGLTIDAAQPAGAAADTDTLWVGQGGSTTARQSFLAIWTWIAARLPSYTPPIIEITASTYAQSDGSRRTSGHL